MKEPSTTFIKNKLDSAINDKEALEFIKNSITPIKDRTFNDYFNEYLGKHPTMKTSEIVKKSGLHRTYAYEIINGNKKGSRDRVIALCFAAEMTVDELNHALLYSGNNQLYPKNTRDAYIEFFFKSKKGSTVLSLNEALIDNDVDELNI